MVRAVMNAEWVRAVLLQLLLALPVWTAVPASAQWTGGAEGKTEQERLLEVRRRQVELRAAQAELDRSRSLNESGLLSDADLERSEVALERAQLAFQEALLSLLNTQPRITVTEAVKVRSESGKQFVRITLKNLTPGLDASQVRLISDFGGEQLLPESLRNRDVRDVYVSIQDAAEGSDTSAYGRSRSTTIGLPYEMYVPELPYGKAKTLVFQLLRDVNSIVVSIASRGEQREIDLELQNAEGEHDVTISALQVSQEADLGSEVTFPLRLERSSVDVDQFELAVLGLPLSVGHQFVEPTGGARVSQVNFSAGVTRMNLQLRLFLPDRPTDEVRIDQPLELWVAAFETRAVRAQERALSIEDLQDSRAGKARLELIPRGVGELEVRADTLLLEGTPGHRLQTALQVHNSGSRRLDNVRFEAHAPAEWRVTLEPPVLPALDVGDQREVVLQLDPPAEVPVGDYEVRLETESLSFNRTVSAADKSFRVRIESSTNLWVLTTLLLTIGTLVVGGVVLGVKLTRR